MVVKKEDIADLVGLTLEEFTTKAQERGVARVRATTIDGKSQMVTKDMRRDRINVSVETKDGRQVVTDIHRFG